MLELARQGHDAVLGYREQRYDRPARRTASWMANAIRRAVLHDHIRDIGCSTRVVRREAMLALSPVPNLNRYLPALLERSGWRIVQVRAIHHPRLCGRSKYDNLRRGLQGIVDLIRMARLAAQHARQAESRTHGV